MNKMISQTLSFIQLHIRSAFLSNSAWIVFEQIFRMALSLVVGVLTARYLGPSNTGLITYGATYVAAFTPVATLSMEYVIIKDIVEKPETSGELLGSGIFLRFIAGIICFFIITVIVSIIKSGDRTYVIIAALNAITLIVSSFTLVDAWLQAQLKSKYATIIKSIGYVLMSAYKVYLLETNKSVIWFAFAASLDAIVIALMYGYFLLVKSHVKIKIDLSVIKHLLQQSFPFILTGIMIVVYGQVDRLFLDYYHGSTALGLYGVASNLSYLWQFIPAAIITSARPVILNAKNIGQDIYLKRMRQLYAFIWWLSILVAILFTVFGDLIVKILYQDQYSGASSILKIFIWSQGFSLLAGARSIWFLAEDKNKYLVPTQLLSAIFSIIMNLLLIPRFGAVGAAISMVLTQAFVAFISTLLVRPARDCISIMIDGILLRKLW